MSLTIGFIGVGAILVLLALRMPIGLSLTLVSAAGIAILRSPRSALSSLAAVPYEFMSHWTLSAVPLFILMGAIASNTGMMEKLYYAMRLWLGKLPGGLAIATCFAGAGFSAVSGSSIATTAAMGRVAVPEMLRLGYDRGLATGTAAAVGTIGVLIPPSILMVLYATFANVSVGKMLLAGIVPGLLTALAYVILIIIRCAINPRLAPKPDLTGIGLREKLLSILPVWPVPAIAAAMMGVIYGGIATATEAAALGVVMVALVALLQKRLSVKVFIESLRQTATTTSAILLLAIGATMLTQFLAFTGVTQYISGFMSDLTQDPLMIMVLVCVLYLILGSILDPLGLMLLTLPVLLPVFDNLGMDAIWAGLILVKMMEIGQLTPPIGLNVFIMRSVVRPEVPLNVIFRGVSWFLIAEFFLIAALLLYPQLVTWLPSRVS